MILLEDRVKEASRLLVGDRVSSCYTQYKRSKKSPKKVVFILFIITRIIQSVFLGGERKCLYGWPLSKAHKKYPHSALICSS